MMENQHPDDTGIVDMMIPIRRKDPFDVDDDGLATLSMMVIAMIVIRLFIQMQRIEPSMQSIRIVMALMALMMVMVMTSLKIVMMLTKY